MKKMKKSLLFMVMSIIMLTMVLSGCVPTPSEEFLDLDVEEISVGNTQTSFAPGEYEITATFVPHNTKHRGFTAKLVNEPQSVGLVIKDDKYYITIGATALDGVSVKVQVNSTYDKTIRGTKEFTLAIPAPDYTMISTEAQLFAMKEDMNGCYRLANDITLTKQWVQIGDARSEQSSGSIIEAKNPFNGILDGNGYAIKGIAMEDTNSNTGYNRGFFGQLTAAAVVQNIGFEGSKMYFRGWSGVIAAHNFGVVKNVYTNIELIVEDGVAGALVAMNYGIVQNSYALGRAFSTTTADIAGLIGVADGTQTGCYADRETTKLTAFSGFRIQNENQANNIKYLLSTQLMQTAKTFVDAGWDEEVWTLEDFMYPVLKHMAL